MMDFPRFFYFYTKVSSLLNKFPCPASYSTGNGMLVE
jgi:hypothetical protein